MKSVALIAEGVTDQLILDAVLQAYFRGDGCYVVGLQPLLDFTDRKVEGAQGGWGHVFRYCDCADKIMDALAFNDVVVIQIDTDICQEYGVSHTGEEDCEHMISIVTDLLHQRLLSAGIDERTIHERVICAVCINSIECWLLPFYLLDKKRAKTSNCAGTLNRQLTKSGVGFYIDEDNKLFEVYEELVKPIQREKHLATQSKENCSLGRFVEILDSTEVLHS